MMKLLLLILCVVVASCTEIHVTPGTIGRINTAIANSVAGDIIILDSGIYTTCSTPVKIGTKSITILGTGNLESIIECSGTGYAFISGGTAFVNITNIIIRNATSAMLLNTPSNVSLSIARIMGSRGIAINVAASGVKLDISMASVSDNYNHGLQIVPGSTLTGMRLDFTHNAGYGLVASTNSIVDLDETCSICMNKLGQVLSNVPIGGSAVCGFITNIVQTPVVVQDDVALYQQLKLSIYGTKMLLNDSDTFSSVSIGKLSFRLSGTALPLEVLLPASATPVVGSVSVRSVMRNYAATYDTYTFTTPTCPVIAFVDPATLRGIVSLGNTLVFDIQHNCTTGPFAIRAYFGKAVASCSVLNNKVSCPVPVSRTVASVDLVFNVYGSKVMPYNLTNDLQYDYVMADCPAQIEIASTSSYRGLVNYAQNIVFNISCQCVATYNVRAFFNNTIIGCTLTKGQVICPVPGSKIAATSKLTLNVLGPSVNSYNISGMSYEYYVAACPVSLELNPLSELQGLVNSANTIMFDMSRNCTLPMTARAFFDKSITACSVLGTRLTCNVPWSQLPMTVDVSVEINGASFFIHNVTGMRYTYYYANCTVNPTIQPSDLRGLVGQSNALVFDTTYTCYTAFTVRAFFNKAVVTCSVASGKITCAVPVSQLANTVPVVLEVSGASVKRYNISTEFSYEYYMADCPVSVSIPASDLRGLVGQSNALVFDTTYTCYTAFTVRAFFNKAVVTCSVASGKITCAVPVSQLANTVPVVLEVSGASVKRYNISTEFSYEYYMADCSLTASINPVLLSGPINQANTIVFDVNYSCNTAFAIRAYFNSTVTPCSLVYDRLFCNVPVVRTASTSTLTLNMYGASVKNLIVNNGWKYEYRNLVAASSCDLVCGDDGCFCN